ncbi:MAG: DNA methyltransferase [Oscillospiraceae bacterium]
MQIQKVNAARLNPAAYNPRRDLKPGDKDYEKLKRSIEEFGFVEPVVWNEATGNVVGGHQRLKVLLDMGETEIDCVVVNLGPEQEKALNLALNRIQGGWDETKLAEVMADLDASAFDVSLTGFDAEEVDALMNKFYSAEAAEDNFDREKAAAEIEAAGGPVTQPGDLWELGNHRLYCGDPAQAESFDFLMGAEQAACAMTAPPAISTAEYKKDGLAPWLDRMAAVVANLCRYAPVICWNIDDLFSTGSQYVEPTGFFSMKLFADYNFRPLWIRVWKKQGALARVGSTHQNSTKPQRQFEYVAAFAGEEAEEINQPEVSWVSAFAAHNYRFVKRLTKEERRKWGYAGVWEMDASQTADGAAQLPVELPWRCMKMHSDPGTVILDPFCGGGTTLIAAEQSGRRCFAMDSDPAACDLAVMRWEQFTGEKARRVKK